MFIGRKKELEELRGQFSAPGKRAVTETSIVIASAITRELRDTAGVFLCAQHTMLHRSIALHT